MQAHLEDIYHFQLIVYKEPVRIGLAMQAPDLSSLSLLHYPGGGTVLRQPFIWFLDVYYTYADSGSVTP